MYRIENWDVFFDWLASHGDLNQRQAMIDWMVDVAREPKEVGVRLPGLRAPVYWALCPVRPYTLVYLVADEHRTIRLVKFGTLP